MCEKCEIPVSPVAIKTIKLSRIHSEWCNIFMKLKGSVDVTYVKVIPKIGYDQINISYRYALLKNMSNPSS